MSDIPCAVPLEELLEKVPVDHRLIVESRYYHGSTSIPVGRHCHAAVHYIRALREQLKNLQEKVDAADALFDAIHKIENMRHAKY